MTMRFGPLAPRNAEPLQSWALSRHDPVTDPEPAADRPVDLLFLHGMAAGAWIWTPEWLGQFQRQGYRCWTMSLPGRTAGATVATDPGAIDRAMGHFFQTGDVDRAVDAIAAALPGAALFDGPDIDDHARSVEDAISAIGRPVAVIGHSLGGAIAQALLRRGSRPDRTVLLCSAPPYGLWRASAEMAVTDLRLWKALFDFSIFGVAATATADEDLMRETLFPNGIAPADFQRFLARMTDESLAATSQAAGLPPFAPLPGPRGDMLVIGAGRDRLVPSLDVSLTGLWYGCRPRILRGAGHLPMIEAEHAAETAGLILDWLNAP